MLDIIEDSRNEFKETLNDKLEREVVAFLNANGGNIYIGVNNNGEVIGINEDVDKMQLLIKDRIKNNIQATTLGLFDIDVKSHDGCKYIHITIASGKEKPYYLTKKGMTPDGCFIRVGSSCEKLTQNQIDNLYAKRTRYSLKNIVSPRQNLMFTQLKIYYEEKKYPINDNFLQQLGLVMEDGKYNYLAYLLADENDVSIKVATYSGSTAYDLIENEEYGYCSLIKATNRVVEKFEMINKTYSKITGDAERKELKKFDKTAIREAVINAIVHNAWHTENPPKFEIFSDHISITSTGGLPQDLSKEEFLKGYSYPKNPELMRVFKDLELVEQLGTGIIRILKSYDKDVYVFSDNFIRVNFKFKEYSELVKPEASLDFKLSETQKGIIELIKQDAGITLNEMANELGITKMTVLRNLSKLKEENMVERIGSTKKGQWLIK